MNILFDYQIFLNQVYGGVSRYYVELYRQLNSRDDINVEIPIKYSINSYLNELDNKFPKMNSRKKSELLMKGMAFYNQKLLIKKIKNGSIDILHPTWYSPYVYKQNYNIKIVTTIHDMIQEIYYPESEKKVIERKKNAIYKSDLVIVDSNNTRNDVLSFYPDINENKVKTIYLASNIFTKKTSSVEGNFAKDYILFVGKRSGYKNGCFLLRSIANVLIENKINLVFAGGGPFTQEEVDLINNLNISKYVYYYNASDEILSYLYKNAFCLVYPTSYEGFGLPILEAMKNDCPVVCSNSSSLPEVGGDAALYFEKDNSEDLANKVKKIVLDNSIRQNMITKGKKQLKKFSWEKTSEELFDAYKSLM